MRKLKYLIQFFKPFLIFFFQNIFYMSINTTSAYSIFKFCSKTYLFIVKKPNLSNSKSIILCRYIAPYTKFTKKDEFPQELWCKRDTKSCVENCICIIEYLNRVITKLFSKNILNEKILILLKQNVYSFNKTCWFFFVLLIISFYISCKLKC